MANDQAISTAADVLLDADLTRSARDALAPKGLQWRLYDSEDGYFELWDLVTAGPPRSGS